MYSDIVDIPIPRWFNLEVTSHCNLKCPFCPTGNGEIPLSARSTLSRENFEVIFDKIRPHAEMVQLFNWGEPFMHKDLLYFVNRLSAAGIGSQISSNLSVRQFDKAELEAIVTSGLESLLASIDGLTQETYTAYRRNGDVDKALTNLHNLRETRDRLGATTPHLIWAFHLNHHNEHEIAAARAHAADIGVDIWFKQISVPDAFQSSKVRRGRAPLSPPARMPVLWRGRQNPRLPKFELDARLPQTCNVCRMPFEIMVIGAQGDVYPCTAVVGDAFVVGNLVRQSVEDVWHGAMRENRAQLATVTIARENTQCFKCEHFPQHLSKTA